MLAYHLLVCIERAFLDQGIHTSWETLRRQLSTHQVVTVRLPTADGRVFTIRCGTRPDKIHTEIYRVVRVPNASCRRLIGGPKIVTKPVREPTSNQHPIFKTRKSGN